MAAVNAGGGIFAGLGNIQLPLQEWVESLPLCTCVWTLGIIATSLLVQCRLLSPFQLFFSLNAVMEKHQYWRLLSSFFYFGPLSLDLCFHVYFVQRYCRLIEESGGLRFAKFSWLLLLSAVSLLMLASSMNMVYLGIPLSNVLVYVWGRRNPDSMLSVLGLFSVRAPHIPWVFLAFNWTLTRSMPGDDLAGVLIGHLWYFFNDVYPLYFHGLRPLDPPGWWEALMNRVAVRMNAAEPIENELQFLRDMGVESDDGEDRPANRVAETLNAEPIDNRDRPLYFEGTRDDSGLEASSATEGSHTSISGSSTPDSLVDDNGDEDATSTMVPEATNPLPSLVVPKVQATVHHDGSVKSALDESNGIASSQPHVSSRSTVPPGHSHTSTSLPIPTSDHQDVQETREPRI